MKRLIDEELQAVYEQFLKMGEIVKQQVCSAVLAFLESNVDSANIVLDSDAKINKLETKIEKNCFKTIALHQPVDSDLRRVVALMKATSDMERIGDHAVNIAHAAVTIDEKVALVDVEQIVSAMSERVSRMLSDALEAYVNLDTQRARDISKEDEAIDNYLIDIQRHVIANLATTPESLKTALAYVSVAGYLERIGDYITNICERIIYMESGEIIELN